MANNKIKTVSFIVPAYNEEKNIRKILEKLNSLKIRGIKKEIIVVDDFSTDKTPQIVQRYIRENKNARIRLISHIKNMGKGAALRTGFENSTGEIIAIQDADLEYNPKDFLKLFPPVIKGEVDVVYGSRFLKKNKTGHVLFYMGNKFLSGVISLLYFQKITDMETCYKVIPRRIFEELKIKGKGFEVEPEITSKILKRGYRILEIPIDYNPRYKLEGKKIRVSDGIKALMMLLKCRFSNC